MTRKPVAPAEKKVCVNTTIQFKHQQTIKEKDYKLSQLILLGLETRLFIEENAIYYQGPETLPNYFQHRIQSLQDTIIQQNELIDSLNKKIEIKT